MKSQFATLLATLIWTISTNVQAAKPIELLPKPISSYSTGEKPNVLWVLDDSNSMLKQVVVPKHFAIKSYLAQPGKTTYVNGGDNVTFPNTNFFESDPDCAKYTYAEFGVIFQDSSQGNNSNVGKCRQLENFPLAWVADWRIRSSDFNTIYFDPYKVYEPWISYPQANFNCANYIKEDLIVGCSSDPDISRDLAVDRTGIYDGFVFEIWEDSRGFSGGSPNLGALNNTSNNIVDMWDTHYQYTVSNSNAWKVKKFVYSKMNSPPSMCWTQPEIEASTNPPFVNCFNITISTLNSSDDHPLKGKISINQLKQNIANWFQYYSSRMNSAKANTGKIFQGFSQKMNFGLMTINDSNILLETDKNQAANLFLKTLYSLDSPSKTPNRLALQRAGEYYKNTSHVLNACQKNVSVLVTDGHWTEEDTGFINVNDEDGDGQTKTLADVAYYYRHNDLRSDFPNIQSEVSNLGKKINHQSMLTFGLTLGLESGLIAGSNGFPEPSLKSDDIWYQPITENNILAKVSDVWHAAFNGDGAFASVYDISEIYDIWGNFFKEIITAEPKTVFSNLLINDKHAYALMHETGQWTGDAVRYNIQANGSYKDPIKLANNLTNFVRNSGSRNIWTYNSSTKETISVDPSLYSNATKSAILNKNFTTMDDSNWLDCHSKFLKGQENTCQKSNEIRVRDNILGDTVKTSPLLLGPIKNPSSATCGGIPLLNYALSTQNRKPYLVFPSNDGVIHVVDVNGPNLEEVWAYTPEVLLPKIIDNMSKGFEHNFYMDGGLKIDSVCIEKQWKTVLVAGFGAGEKGFFALDMSYTTSFKNGQRVLWEQKKSEFGNALGSAQIGCVDDNKCYAFGQTGYNSDVDTIKGLGIINIKDGSIVKFIKIPTPSLETLLNENNGISAPVLVDFDGDGFIETAYAGDLRGTLWFFDLINSTSNATAIFQDPEKNPITVKPTVSRRPDTPGVVINFGTGRGLTFSDYLNKNFYPTYTIYGIYQDPLNPTLVDISKFNKTQFTNESLTKGDFQIRQAKRVGTDLGASAEGWYLPLLSPDSTVSNGERVIKDPIIISDFVLFETDYYKKSDSSCGFNITNWAIDLNSFTGLPRKINIDLDGDQVIESFESSTSAAGYRRNSNNQDDKLFFDKKNGNIYTIEDAKNVTLFKRKLDRPYKIMNRIDVR
ncbi:MAG: PilC/PilY family type IV pilus protein [Pseudomonadota bacterium]